MSVLLKFADSLKIEARGDREVVIARTFGAPKKLVFEALTTPKYVQQWMLGPEGWTMPVCEIDLRVGGRYRYEYSHPERGASMGISGEYMEISPYDRIVHTEQFDQPWYVGEAIITTILIEKDGLTHFEAVILATSKEARDQVLASGMSEGVRASYDRLEQILAGL